MFSLLVMSDILLLNASLAIAILILISGVYAPPYVMSYVTLCMQVKIS